MSTNETTANNIEIKSHTRRRVMGIIFLVIAALIWIIFARNAEPGVQTTYRMVPGGSKQEIQDWVFSSLPMLKSLAGLSLMLGGYQLARGFKKQTNLVLGLVAGMFIFAFLSWAAADGSLNLAGLIRSSLVKAIGKLRFGNLEMVNSESDEPVED